MSRATQPNGYDSVKRIFDIVLSLVGILISWPLQLVIAVLVWKKLGSPVVFRQNRPGLDGEIFELIKFRTMIRPDVSKGIISDEDRLTPFGRFLRSTSMDELPTLLNVFKGDMSMVGPRPLLVSYLTRYTSEQNKRHQVRPGITGLAQVRGRNALTWEEKFALDVYYVQNRSLALDLRILLETVTSVLTRRGITAADSATMPEFLGDTYPEKQEER